MATPQTNPSVAEDSEQNSAKSKETSGAQSTGETKPKLSGAARRKLKKQREQASGESGSAPPDAQPSTSRKEGGKTIAGTSKRYRSDGSTPEARASKKPKGTVKETRSYKDAITGFQMAFADENPEKSLTEEETGRLKTWILQKIDSLGTDEVHPRFTECRHRAGTLRISCSDQATRDWVSMLLSQETPWEGAKLRFVEAKNLPKPVRTLVWIPGPPEDPQVLISRLEKQNGGISTTDWKVVDKKEDPKGQQLIVLMDQTSWDKMGTCCDHRPYVNFSRVLFKVLSKPKREEEEEEKMDVEGQEGAPPTSTD